MAENNTSHVDLPEDLIINILLRLPFKSLIRFQSVSRSWKLLIRSEIPPESLFIIRDHDSFRKEYNLPFDIIYSVGSCNGIICFRTTWNCPYPLLLFNPSIREFSFLPQTCKAHFYGFCYLSQTKEYKVVCFTMQRRGVVDMTILTSGMKKKCLREVKGIVLPSRIARSDNCRPAIFETCMVWFGYDPDLDKSIVICYDVLEDRFSKMDLPPNPTEDLPLAFSFRLLRNSVVSLVRPHTGATYFEVWSLISDGGGSNGKSWIKYKKVAPSNAMKFFDPVHVSSDLKLIIWKTVSGGLLYYDHETNKVINYEAANPQVGIRDFVKYVETHVSPQSLVTCPFSE